MAKKDDNEEVEAEVVEQGSDPEVELDRPTEIEGDLIENPVLEVENVPGEEPDDEVPAGTEEVDSENTDGEDNDSSEATDETDAGESEQTTEADLAPEKDETGVYSPPAPDPGDFQPTGNYGFEVTTADGKSVKINTPEEADAFARRLDTEDSLLTPYQFTQFNRAVLKMDSGIDRERVQYETQKEAFETQQAQEKIRNDQVVQWNNELNYLQAKGIIPAVPKAIDVPNGWTNNPENAAVKARMDIFRWMEKENTDRRSAGIAEITSAVDAHSLMQAENQNSGVKEEKSREMTERRSRGKMVSGNSSFTPGNEQSNSIVGEGGSLNDLVQEYSASI